MISIIFYTIITPVFTYDNTFLQPQFFTEFFCIVLLPFYVFCITIVRENFYSIDEGE